MEQLPGFQQHIRHSPLVYKLNKAIYGLKQAPQAWFERLQQFRFSIGLFPLKLIVHCFFESLISQLRFFWSTLKTLLLRVVSQMIFNY